MNGWVGRRALAVIISACGLGGGPAAASPSPSPIAAGPSPSPAPSGLSFKVTGADPTVTASGTATLQVQAGSRTLELAGRRLQPNSKHVSPSRPGSRHQPAGHPVSLRHVAPDAADRADAK